MRISRHILARLTTAAAALLALSGCKPPAKQAPADTALVVSTQNARVGDVSRTVTVTGSLAALHEVALSAKQPGRLIAVYVREGDSVAADQVLARVDDADLLRQVRTAEAALASSAARLRQAEAAYAQQVTTGEATIAAARAAYGQQVATSEAAAQSAESAVKAARANLSALREGARAEERQQTQAALRVAEASYRSAETDLARYRKLHEAGYISDAEFDQHATSHEVAQANLKAAQASVELQRNGTRRQDLEQAQERVRQMEEALRQAQAGRAQDAVRKAELDSAIAGRAQNRVRMADVDAARASLQQARNALAVAHQAVADAVVRAPFGGCIAARSAEPGQVVNSASVLLRLVTADEVYFEPSVPEDAIRLVRVGQRVDVTLDSYPGRAFGGKVSRIYPTSSSASRAVAIRVTVPSGQGLLRPQMFATGRIIAETRRNVVMAPRASVVAAAGEGSGASRVFSVAAGVAQEHTVTTGLASADGAWVEVTGIDAGTAVVVQGLSGLSDGAKVTVNDQVAAR